MSELLKTQTVPETNKNEVGWSPKNKQKHHTQVRNELTDNH